jgi:uncharacterized protein (UPF0332 family)
MKPQSTKFIEQANILLHRADRMLEAGLNEDAARTAYLACFHIAQAYIFERTDRTSKTHKGVQTTFFRLTRENPRVDPELRPFLSQAYEFKSIADYLTGPDAVTSAEEAVGAVGMAKRFVDHFGALVPVG